MRPKRWATTVATYFFAIVVALALFGGLILSFGRMNLDGRNGISQEVLNLESRRGPRPIHGFRKATPAEANKLAGADD